MRDERDCGPGAAGRTNVSILRVPRTRPIGCQIRCGRLLSRPESPWKEPPGPPGDAQELRRAGPMLQDAENDQSHWKEWNKAEAIVLRLLATSRLPAAEQEIAATLVLAALLRACREGRGVENAAAWACTVVAREIGKLRARGLARTLGDESEAVGAPSPGAEALPELSDLRAFVLAHEGAVQEKLSAVEREVYLAVRKGLSLREVAASLSMSERDVRTRFRRVCAKVHGILGHLVPPPPLQGELHEVLAERVGQDRHGVV